MKKITFIIITLLTINISFGQTTLTEGDIAITGVIADNPDEFSFVLLTDVLTGTTIHFTDNGWLVTGGFRTPGAEGIVTWTATSDLLCGTEIVIADTGSVTPNTYSSTSGTAVETNSGFALASAGDQIIVYQGISNSNPTFLYAVHFGSGTGWVDATDNNNSAVPSGLTEGVTAIDLGNSDNSNYLCTVTSNQTLILEAVATVNVTNWYQTNSNSVANRPVLGGCIYTCVAAGSCASTVTWNGSAWAPITGPNLTTAVILNGNYNTGANGNFSACSLTVNTGFTLTVSDLSFVEVENDVIVDGTINVSNQGSFVQNDNAGTFTLNASGTSSVNKTTATKQAWYYYTFWSSPVVGQTIAGAFPNTDGDRRFYFNAANYIDANGDDIDDDNNDWTYALGGDVMTPGIGYASASGRLGLYPGTDSANFIGPFNTGDISTGISYNALNITGSWNLIGNPYPSAIDFIAFQSANSTVIDGAAYIWSQSLPPLSSNPGNQVLNFNQNDYATFTVGTGGVAGASGIIPTQYIPTGQSFFVSGLLSSNVTFTNAMRMADGTSNSLLLKNSKKKANSVANKLWINLTSDNGVFNQILVGYVDGATNKNDGLGYDAPKLLSSEAAILYSKVEDSDKIFAIQGKAVNSIDIDEVIQLGFKTTINVATLYKLSIAQLQGDFLNGNTMYLKDNLLNKTHNLSDSDYTFTSEVGEFNNRFQVVFVNGLLSTNDIDLDENALRITELDDNFVQFKASNNLRIKAVNIYDLLGRQLYSFKGKNTSETYNLSKLNSAIYIAKVELSNGLKITKKAIKR